MKTTKFKLGRKNYCVILYLIFLPLISFSQENKDLIKSEPTVIIKSGAILINNETHFYTKLSNKATKYYNKFGQEVNTKGEIVKKQTLKSIIALSQQDTSKSNSGKVLIKGKVYYYNKIGDKISYYDQKGNEVDENGKLISFSNNN